MDIVLGFTGARNGLMFNQRAWLLLHMPAHGEIRHGDCVGADAEVHEIAKSRGCYIVVHPPVDSRFRAHCKGDEGRSPLEYLERNKAIVAACDVLVAFPREGSEKLRSGTWMTIRYAAQANKPRVIVFPSGDVKIQWPKSSLLRLSERYMRLRNFALKVIFDNQRSLGKAFSEAVFVAVKCVEAIEEDGEESKES